MQGEKTGARCFVERTHAAVPRLHMGAMSEDILGRALGYQQPILVLLQQDGNAAALEIKGNLVDLAPLRLVGRRRAGQNRFVFN